MFVGSVVRLFTTALKILYQDRVLEDGGCLSAASLRVRQCCCSLYCAIATQIKVYKRLPDCRCKDSDSLGCQFVTPKFYIVHLDLAF